MTQAHFHRFDDGPALAEALADKVADVLRKAISERGGATLAVSGGSTPKLFFRALARRVLDWGKVTVTLVDERMVAQDNERSNHRFVAAELLTGNAAAAQFLPLYHPADNPDEAARLASKAVSVLKAPFDVVILGMGNDGHTASFFPEGDRLAEAIEPGTPRGVISINAPGAGEPRLTFTFSSLEDARFLVLHVEGQAKFDTLEKAQGDGDEATMPIRAILRRANTPLDIFWAP